MDVESQRLRYVKITNNMPEVFTDRYDGVPIVILPGRSENLPQDMAAHFFGANFEDTEAMFKHICKRQGWNTLEFVSKNDEYKPNRARWNFNHLKIEPIVYKLVAEEKPDPRKPVPASTDLPDELPRRPGRPTNAELEARRAREAS